MIGTEFVKAGRAIFTLSVPQHFVERHTCQDRYTFSVVHKEVSDKWPEAWFVNLLAGPDNLRDYNPLGKLNPETGAVQLVRSSSYNDHTMPVKLFRRVVACLWNVGNSKPEDIENAGFELRHAGRCGRCGRVLTVPESIDTGLGPTCAAKLIPTFSKWK